MNYQPHIDGLRAIAVLTVILFHLGASPLGGGFVGVDIFFVISGYLITSLILTELKQTGSFSAKRFYLKRARRLLPALFATIVITTVAAVTLLSSLQLKAFGIEVVTGALSISNFLFWAQSGYFDASSDTKPLLHLWSLSVEEQFYLFWPLTLAFIFSFTNKKKLPLVLFTIFSLSIVLTTTLTNYELSWFRNQTEAIFFLAPFRIYEFIIGALIIFFVDKMPIKKIYLEGVFLVGAACIFWAITQFNMQTPFPSFNALIPCIGTALLILSKDSILAKQLLANRLMTYIGLISYTLYLVHWPVIVLYKDFHLNPLTLIDNVKVLFIICSITLMIFYGVERPIRKKKIIITSRLFAAWSNYIYGFAGIILGGIILISTSGLADFKDELYSQRAISQGESDRYTLIKDACKIATLNSDACDLDRSIQVLVIGNSHEPDGYNIFHQVTQNNHQVNLILFGGTNHCEIGLSPDGDFVSNVKRNRCDVRTNQLNNKALIESLDLVIYSSNKPFANNKTANWSALTKLHEINPKINLIVLGTYFNSKHRCADLANKFSSTDACKKPEFLSYSGINERNSITATQITKGTPYTYISKFEALCSEDTASFEKCPTIGYEEPMYYDQHHLSIGFSKLIGDKLTEKYNLEFKNLNIID